MTDYLVTGDTRPVITGTIHARDDATDLEVLTGCTVKFQMRRKRDRRLMVDADAEVTSTVSGGVAYSLGENDTAVPGEYVIEWQVTYPDGRKQTTADLREITIRRR